MRVAKVVPEVGSVSARRSTDAGRGCVRWCRGHRGALARRLAAAFALALALAAVAAAAAPVPGGLRMRPALASKTTLPQGHFTFALPAGTTAQDAVVLESAGGSALQAIVSAADLRRLPGGGAVPAAPGSVAHGAGPWIRVARREVSLRPGVAARVPFALSVPARATPGAYDGAVVAEAVAGTTASGLAVLLRLALIVHVVVVASPRPQLAVGPPAATAGPAGETFSVPLRNEGNVNLNVAGLVVLRDARGRVRGRVPLGPRGLYVVPGGRAVLRGAWAWPSGARSLTAVARIRTAVGSRPGPLYTSAASALVHPTRASDVPGLAMAAVAAAAAAVGLGRVRRRAAR